MDTETVTLAVGQGRVVSARIYNATAEQRAGVTLILAHGAGAPQAHPFIVAFAKGFAERGLDVVTFNFPYMEEKRRVPDPAPVLEACYADVLRLVRGREELAGNRLVIGGKSMGGRMASQLVARDKDAAADVAALVFLGYPLHPPGKPAQLRSRHLPDVGRPMLFVQGSRDAFGAPEELAPIVARLGPPSQILVVEGGDHSLAVPKSSGSTKDEVFARVQDEVVKWIGRLAMGDGRS